MKFNGGSYSSNAKDIQKIWCRSTKLLWKSKFSSGSGSGSGSWYYFGFQYQTYISCIEDTHQILLGSTNTFESYCVHMKSPRTYVHPDRQADRQTEIFFCTLSFNIYKTWTFIKRRIFFFTHAITILSLFTYSVCDEKVIKRWLIWNILCWVLHIQHLFYTSLKRWNGYCRMTRGGYVLTKPINSAWELSARVGVRGSSYRSNRWEYFRQIAGRVK